MTDAPITLWCFVWGSGPGTHSSFPVTISDPRETLVGHMKDLVLEKKRTTLAAVDADSLRLWKIEQSKTKGVFNGSVNVLWKSVSDRGRDEGLKFLGGEALNPLHTIWSLFGPESEDPPLPDHMHVIVEMPPPAREAQLTSKLSYELPKLVTSVMMEYLESSKAIAVVAALFASLEAALITLIKTPVVDNSGNTISPSHPGAFKMLLILSYFPFVLSVSIVISSLIMVDQLGSLPFKSRNTPPKKEYTEPEAMLIDFNLPKRFTHLVSHCLMSLTAAAICVFAQILLYVWLKESVLVFGLVLAAVAWGGLPLLFLPTSGHSE